MANVTDPLELLRARKAKIEELRAKEAAERARLEALAAKRAKEEEEVAMVERVLARWADENASQVATADAGSADDNPESASGSVEASVLPRRPPGLGSPRPEGIPTVPEMVTRLLLDAEQQGKRGLTSAEILEGVEKRWWSGVPSNAIMPTVYRCIAKEHWFSKEGKLFVRLRGGQPPRRRRYSITQLERDN
ncbi:MULTISPECIES: hypothetical protein [unclassified Bradyrhizobium]|uniref:hypothetical protein n=1 Tax=unclassified Bradyrhizobium TaxID=2631580 RepID=UPI0028ED9753|nr:MULTISPECIES: hypothetical protein [unclassified Bradyrhizobium]